MAWWWWIAARAATDPHLPLRDIAAEFRALGLDALDSEDPTASLLWLDPRDSETLFGVFVEDWFAAVRLRLEPKHGGEVPVRDR